MRFAAVLLRLLLPLTLVSPAAAQWAGWDYANDKEITPWAELEAKIPRYPGDAGLLPFEAGPTSGHRFFIEPSSLSIGEDGVVRYILVVRTSGGATNVSFEGMRCETREQKTYAIGQRDGVWTRARDPQWKRIEYKEFSRQHGILYRDFLCRGKAPAASVREIVQLLKYPPRPAMND